MIDARLTKHRCPARLRPTLLLGCAAVAMAMPVERASAQAFDGIPTIQAGMVDIDRSQPGKDLITVDSPSAVINWGRGRFSGPPPAGAWLFLPAGNEATFQGPQGFAVLNRILPFANETVTMDGTVLGRLAGAGPNNLTANGTIAFYTPNGLLIGGNAVFDVGSLILTTLDPLYDTDGFFIDATGSINFQADPLHPTSAVTTLAGAQINAVQDGSFVILAAPQVRHGGAVRVNGSAAYIAAAGAVVRYDAGLFDIFITGGTTVTDALTHTGSTTGPASTGAGDAHNIYMTAVSQNQAINALVGGTIGYDPPISATVENGAIILTAVAVGSPPDGAAQANLALTNGTFSSDVTAASTHNVSASGTIAFQQDLNMAGARSALLSAAGAGQVISVGGNLSMSSSPQLDTGPAIDRTGGDVRVSATSGGRVQVAGNATVDATALGRRSDDGTIGNGTGGTAAVETDNGTIVIAGNLDVRADGGVETSEAIPNTGGAGTGGTVRVSAGNAGSVSVGGGLLGSASGFASLTNGTSALPAGAGTGGSTSVGTATGGQVSVAGSSTLQALGIGGSVQGGSRTGGMGSGGNVRVESNSGQVTLAGPVIIDARGGGGFAPTGGTGTGGNVVIQASNGGRVNLPSSTAADASGLGAPATFEAGGTGGNATGGTINVRAIGGPTGGQINAGTMALFAAGAGGGGSSGLPGAPPVAAGNGANGQGGAVEVSADADTGLLNAGQLLVNVTGIGGNGGSAGAPGQVAGAGGNGSGGTVVAGLRAGPGPGSAGSANFTRVELIAGGSGGNGGAAGSGTGGTTRLQSVGGNRLQVTGPTILTSTGTGGTGRTGGSGQGGTAEIVASAGTVTLGNGASLDASGQGGSIAADGLSAGAGSGGTARIEVAGAATQVNVTGSANLAAAGRGGFSQSVAPVTGQIAGDGNGGTSAIQVSAGGALAVSGPSNIGASGSGGIAATAGAGRGGAATIEASGAGSNVSLGNAYVHADGQAAVLGPAASAVNGGGSTGGVAAVRSLAGATIAFGSLAVSGPAPFPASASVSARALRGAAYSGSQASNAQGGTAIMSASGGTITAGSGVQVTSNATGGTGLGNARGGNATGGTSALSASSGGSVTVAGIAQVTAAALAGNGAGSGNGGDARGGAANLHAPAGSVRIQGAGESLVDARGTAGDGATGGTGRGGSAELAASAGTGLVTAAGTARLTADGIGGAGTVTGGLGQGGAVRLSANSSVLLGRLAASADGHGGNSAGGAGSRGGDGQGGSVAIAAGPGSSMEAGAAGANTITARGLGGTGATGGAATGGTISAVVAATGRLALTGAGTTLDASALAGDAAGTANSGSVTLQSDGTIDVSALTVAADAAAGQGNGGTVSIGGTGTVNYQSAAVTADGSGANPQAGGIQLRNMAGAPGTSTLTAATSGPLSATTVTAGQSIALSSSGGNLNATGLSAGQNVALTTAAGSLNATNVTANAISATTGSGALTATNLTAGQTVALTSASGAVSATNVGAGQSIAVGTSGTATLAGNVAAPNIQVSSADIAIQTGASVGAPGAAVTFIVRPTTAQAVVGGAAQGPGYTLDNAEGGRILAASLTVAAPAIGTGATRAPDLLVRDLALDGTRVTSLTLATPGIVQVEGALAMTNGAAANAIVVSGSAERVQLLTPGGSVRLRDSAGAAAGTVQIAAGDIWVGDQAMLGQLLANRSFAGRNNALLNPAAVSAPRGYIEGFDVVLRPTASLLVQNSGTRADFGGITVGHSLTIQAGTAAAPADVYAFGRRQQADGTASFGTMFFFEPDYLGHYTAQSEFNTCVINTRACPSAGGGLPGDDIETPVDGPGFSTVLPLASRDLIDEAALSEPLIEEPVTSGGDSTAWTADAGDRGEDEEDEEEEEQQQQPVPPAGRPAATTDRGGNQ